MKITYKDDPIDKKVPVKHIPSGIVFSGFIGNEHGDHEDKRRLLMKVYQLVVDLENPGKTWSETDNLYIYRYEELDAELIVSQK